MFLNYVLLRGINDSREDARWLARVDRHAFLVKIAALNETAGTPSDLVGASLDEISLVQGGLEPGEAIGHVVDLVEIIQERRLLRRFGKPDALHPQEIPLGPAGAWEGGPFHGGWMVG